MKLEDPASVIYFSPTRFNAYRDQLAQNNNPLPTLVGKKHVVRDLRKYLFDGFVFYGITFSGVTFGNLKGVTFNQCIFQECRFSHNDQPLIEGFSGASIQDTIFFECTFRATDFSGGDLCRVRFVEPDCSPSPEFVQCRFDDFIALKQKQISKEFLRNLVCGIFRPDCRIVLRGEVESDRFNWESVRSLSKLPFLQVSLVGIILFSLLTIWLGEIRTTISSAVSECNSFEVPIASLAERLRSACEVLGNQGLVDAFAYHIVFFFFTSLALFGAALSQHSKCPPEVLEFSRTNWENSLRRPPETYSLLASETRFWFVFSTLLYSVSLGALAYKTLRALSILFFDPAPM